MMRSPYLEANRLQDVIAALQFLGTYKDYKLSAQEWDKQLKSQPMSAGGLWSRLFSEHPEFFRESDSGVSLVWRRALRHDEEDRRPPLESKDIGMMIDAAIRLRQAAVEDRRERRWWLPIVVAVITFIGALLGAWIGAKGRANQAVAADRPVTSSSRPASQVVGR
jgi:hypothetical protein